MHRSMKFFLCSEFHWLKVWMPSPDDFLSAISNPVVPILLYGAEIWTLSKVELSMLECAHRNILRTIQGLPTRCHSSSLNYMLGSNNIESMIFQHKLNFVNSIISLDNNSLPKKLLIKRTQDPLAKGVIPDLQTTLDHLNLLSINILLDNPVKPTSWKRSNYQEANWCQILPQIS